MNMKLSYAPLLLALLLALLFVQAAFAQDPYERALLIAREAIVDSQGRLPQPYLALTNANVVDVRTGKATAGCNRFTQSIGIGEPFALFKKLNT
jgi:putative cell wall-binding protein